MVSAVSIESGAWVSTQSPITQTTICCRVQSLVGIPARTQRSDKIISAPEPEHCRRFPVGIYQNSLIFCGGREIIIAQKANLHSFIVFRRIYQIGFPILV